MRRNRNSLRALCAAALALCLTGAASPDQLPSEVIRRLPAGYDVLAWESAGFAGPGQAHYIVALSKHGEEKGAHGDTLAPARPLLLFARRPDGSFAQTGRNDDVILRADEGGQCDPFDDGGDTIAVKGRYVTIENGVACGAHWTDYITFRFDDAVGTYVFDNERAESWKLNSSDAPGAEALVRAGPQHLTRANPARPVRFEDWRPSR